MGGLSLTLGLLEVASPDRSARVIERGGGASVLFDALVERGYQDVAILDFAEAALERAKRRLDQKASPVRWIVADMREATDLGEFCFWHDRAVFHFMTRMLATVPPLSEYPYLSQAAMPPRL